MQFIYNIVKCINKISDKPILLYFFYQLLINMFYICDSKLLIVSVDYICVEFIFHLLNVVFLLLSVAAVVVLGHVALDCVESVVGDALGFRVLLVTVRLR